MKTPKAVGIDLDTINSDRFGRRIFPSVVVYDKRSDSLKAGQAAFARRGPQPKPVVSIESHMGEAAYGAVTGSLSLSLVEVSSTIRCPKSGNESRLSPALSTSR